MHDIGTSSETAVLLPVLLMNTTSFGSYDLIYFTLFQSVRHLKQIKSCLKTDNSYRIDRIEEFRTAFHLQLNRTDIDICGKNLTGTGMNISMTLIDFINGDHFLIQIPLAVRIGKTFGRKIQILTSFRDQNTWLLRSLNQKPECINSSLQCTAIDKDLL